jgi:hypothetical protein
LLEDLKRRNVHEGIPAQLHPLANGWLEHPNGNSETRYLGFSRDIAMQHAMFSCPCANMDGHLLSEHGVPSVLDFLTQSFVRIVKHVSKS